MIKVSTERLAPGMKLAKPVLAANGKEYESVVKISQEKELVVSEAESTYFDESHANVGRLLAEKWRFPGNLAEAIACHHKPHLAKLAPMETAIVHFSDILVRARGLGFAGDYFVPSFDSIALTLYNAEDLKKGCIESVDRQGKKVLFPLVTISIGITDTVSKKFDHYGAVAEAASEMKHYAKQSKTSCYRWDRRTGN